MSVDSVISGAVEQVLPGACFPNVYTGNLLQYAVWAYTELPEVFAERAPHAARYLVQVHYYLPHKENPNATKRRLQRVLFDAGCTWPSITNASDADGQHYVLECEYADGGGYYGQPAAPGL